VSNLVWDRFPDQVIPVLGHRLLVEAELQIICSASDSVAIAPCLASGETTEVISDPDRAEIAVFFSGDIQAKVDQLGEIGLGIHGGAPCCVGGTLLSGATTVSTTIFSSDVGYQPS
jgi:hypothetical protein